ncbi:MAG TPA: hypothetical protein PKY59_04495 [Pyrinomonadaceae bacterium]|nr:hypothetical protein [Pyrinomonadaceae bacterium]
MKKLVSLSMLLGAVAFTGTIASAQTYNGQNRNHNQPIFSDRDERNYNNDNERDWRNNDRRRVKVETQYRIVRQGRIMFRETIEIKHFPNGRTVKTVIKRERIYR